MPPKTYPDVPIGAIVLAAGLSRRMGQSKMLLPFGDKPLLAHTVANLQRATKFAPILVVIGPQEEEVREVVREYDPVFVSNPAFAEGEMLSSVQAGVRALPAGVAAFLLVLGDQPQIRPETFRTLRTAWLLSNAPIVVPTYAGKRGHPILFAASCIPQILALPPDATLKEVVTHHTERILRVPVPDPGIHQDIDTPADYTAALNARPSLKTD